MYTGGTTLLTEAYAPAEKARTQGSNDFIVFAVMGVSSFASGVLVIGAGWETMNVGALPFIAAVATAALWPRAVASPRRGAQSPSALEGSDRPTRFGRHMSTSIAEEFAARVGRARRDADRYVRCATGGVAVGHARIADDPAAAHRRSAAAAVALALFPAVVSPVGDGARRARTRRGGFLPPVPLPGGGCGRKPL